MPKLNLVDGINSLYNPSTPVSIKENNQNADFKLVHEDSCDTFPANLLNLLEFNTKSEIFDQTFNIDKNRKSEDLKINFSHQRRKSTTPSIRMD